MLPFVKQGTLPPLPNYVERKDDDVIDVQEEPHIPKIEFDLADEHMVTTDPLDPPMFDPPSTIKTPLWLHDTLQDVERHVVT